MKYYPPSLTHQAGALLADAGPPWIPASALQSVFWCFSWAAYCVYEVYSWDVMEPATYFLMVGMVECCVGLHTTEVFRYLMFF